jgi:hypothetical protein
MHLLVLGTELDTTKPAPPIAPWEVKLDSDSFDNDKKRRMTLQTTEIISVTIVAYPWFANSDLIELKPRKDGIVDITRNGNESQIRGNLLDGVSKRRGVNINATVGCRRISRAGFNVRILPCKEPLVNIYVYAQAMGGNAFSIPNGKVRILFDGRREEFSGLRKDKYSIIAINAVFGWNNSWIRNGQTHAAFIGLHGAFVSGNPATHACIVVFAAPGSVFYEEEYNNDEQFKRYSGNSRYMTFGGQASRIVGGHVISVNNRPSDVNLNIKGSMLRLNVDVTQIHNLITSEENFSRNQATANLKYEPVPSDANNSYNSNSFARGLLNASGIVYDTPVLAPGWGRPIPILHFR